MVQLSAENSQILTKIKFPAICVTRARELLTIDYPDLSGKKISEKKCSLAKKLWLLIMQRGRHRGWNDQLIPINGQRMSLKVSS